MPFQKGNKIWLGKKHSQTTIEKLKLAKLNNPVSFWLGKKRPNLHRKGKNNPNYIFDRTKLAKSNEKRNDTAHHEWSKQVKHRDNWKCRIINENCKGRLEAHHILNWRDFPELRYEINNGITLCHAHHPRGRENEAKLSPYLQELVAEKKLF